MNENTRKTILKSAVWFLNNTWLLDVYTIIYNEKETILEECVKSIVDRCVHEIEKKCMSNEFEYARTGFSFVHFGRRGITVSIWHLGNWGQTNEVFCCSWYCYGRNISGMELLDSAEPILSKYEIRLLEKKLEQCDLVFDLVKPEEEIQQCYLRITSE